MDRQRGGSIALRALRDLLLGLFRPNDLYQFLHLRLGDEGLAIARSLPLQCSEEGLAYEVVIRSLQRGLIDDEFFAALVAERPRREADIREVQRSCSLR